MIMQTGIRKLLLTAHVSISVGWLGAVVGFLTLSMIGLTSHDLEMARSAYVSMYGIAWYAIVPLAFLALITGIVCSLGTSWGLIRYYWILFKLIITTLAITVLMIHMQPIDLLAQASTQIGGNGHSLVGPQRLMVVASSLAIIALTLVTALSIYKPRGTTPWGARRTP